MATGLILIGLLFGTIIGGGLLVNRLKKKWLNYCFFAVNFLLLVLLVFWGANLIAPHLAYAAEAGGGNAVSNNGLAYLAAGLAVGIASIGAGLAVGIAGSAAIGAISEKPEILGRALIIIGLGEGIAIYGLIISIIILGRL